MGSSWKFKNWLPRHAPFAGGMKFAAQISPLLNLRLKNISNDNESPLLCSIWHFFSTFWILSLTWKDFEWGQTVLSNSVAFSTENLLWSSKKNTWWNSFFVPDLTELIVGSAWPPWRSFSQHCHKGRTPMKLYHWKKCCLRPKQNPGNKKSNKNGD